MKKASPSRRATGIAPFHVMKLLDLARRAESEGRDIVHMEIGEPDFPAPGPVLAAACSALEKGFTHYTPALGLPQLRAAIAQHYSERQGIAISPERIVVTPGSSGALQLVLAALLDVGDELLVTDPGYPCNRHILETLGARAVPIAVGAESAYQPAPADIEARWTPRTRGVLLASPSNPCGSTLTPEVVREIAKIVEARGGRLIMDEIYHGLVYSGEAVSALGTAPDCFVVNSFSKYFGMTGFRIGWLVAPEEFVAAIDHLAQNLFLAVNTPAQYAALAAFAPETIAILEVRREEFRRRRDLLLPAVRQLGFGVPRVPEGAFYIYADAGAFTADSLAFVHELLDQTGVVITPGVDFGEHRARHHVRFAYTTGIDRMEKGLERLRGFLRAGG